MAGEDWLYSSQTNEKPQSWTDWGNNEKKVFCSINYVPDIIPSIL